MQYFMDIFSEQVLNPIRHSFEVFPDRNAFCIAGKFYTYRDLAYRVSAIRTQLQCYSAKEKILPLAIHDDIDTYASIVALWMEGKSYVPLHPNQPLDRNLNIIDQVDAHCIIDSFENSMFIDWAEKSDNHTIILSSKAIYEKLNLDEWRMAHLDDLAYVLFTSGSTGTPKGVMISRLNVGAFLDSFWKTDISINEEDKCLQSFDLTFDVSVQSYLVALTRGACVYTVPYGSMKYLYVASLIQEEGITFGAMAPSMLTYLRPYFGELSANSLKTCILTAEACPVDLMEEWHKCATNSAMYDFYGPTEATVYCTYYKLTPGEGNLNENGIISIGKPLANIDAIIIDEDGEVVAGSRKGELCVAGNQVTQGYWNNPQKNEECFFERNLDGKAMRFYHTGDLVYRHETGNIMYCGRIDQQAKIQGFRVELGEIEYHAREYYAKERRVVAIAFENEKSLTEIALFIEGAVENTDHLVAYLRSKMPSYMIPSKVIFREEFPLNASEKINRTQLKSELL